MHPLISDELGWTLVGGEPMIQEALIDVNSAVRVFPSDGVLLKTATQNNKQSETWFRMAFDLDQDLNCNFHLM